MYRTTHSSGTALGTSVSGALSVYIIINIHMRYVPQHQEVFVMCNSYPYPYEAVYGSPMGQLLLFVCENPHVAKDVLAASEYLLPEDIMSGLLSGKMGYA